jgi:WhiB family transcriptional regulator, redox-sensing transcriptional regulator
MVIRREPGFVDHDVATDWRHAAECVRHAHEVNFFPERGESALKAKTICAACPVRQPCLEFALRTNVSSGVWGGLTGRQRRQLRRQRETQSRRTQLTL